MEKIAVDVETNWSVYFITDANVRKWIKSHPIDLWAHGYAQLHFEISPELESWLLLRWS
jgi:hypothetical protein